MIKLTQTNGVPIYVHKMAIFLIESHVRGSLVHLMAIGTPAKCLTVKETPSEVAAML